MCVAFMVSFSAALVACDFRVEPYGNDDAAEAEGADNDGLIRLKPESHAQSVTGPASTVIYEVVAVIVDAHPRAELPDHLKTRGRTLGAL